MEYNRNMIKTLKFFASANTGAGFVNHFQYINDINNGYNFILKGGSGTGKSTLMKKVANYFLGKGHRIEYFYCSSDVNSLDGIRIVEKNIAIIDGTSPHITEAPIPKINSEIVNLGEFINDSVRKNRKEIENILKAKSDCYIAFYKNLEIANSIDKLCDYYLEKEKVDTVEIANGIIKSLKLKQRKFKIQERQLFNSAVSIDGLLKFNYDTKKTISLDLNKFYASKVLEILSNKIAEKGYEVIVFNNIISPNKIDEILVPALDTKIVIRENEIYQLKKLETKKEYFISNASKVLLKIRQNHSKLEKFYINSLNIEGLNGTYYKLISKIENM